MKQYNENQDDHDVIYKIILIGDTGVGKSNILTRFTKDQFSTVSKTTIGVQFATKNIITSSNQKIKLQVWDTAGQQRYRSIASAYYRGVLGAFLVYDITRTATFDNIQKWLKQVKSYTNQDLVCLLVGNKADLQNQRMIKTQIGQQYANRKKLFFIETSALNSNNIQDSFRLIVEQISKKEIVNPQTRINLKKQIGEIKTGEQKKKKRCC